MSSLFPDVSQMLTDILHSQRVGGLPNFRIACVSLGLIPDYLSRLLGSLGMDFLYIMYGLLVFF